MTPEDGIFYRMLSRFTLFLVESSATTALEGLFVYLDSIESKNDESRSFLIMLSMEDSLMFANETLRDWFG